MRLRSDGQLLADNVACGRQLLGVTISDEFFKALSSADRRPMLDEARSFVAPQRLMPKGSFGRNVECMTAAKSWPVTF